MANNLTGGFDAVVQFAIRQINGVLATLHQNGASDDATLKLLHRATVRIGDSKWRTPDVTSFGDWVVEYQTTNTPVDIHDLQTQLTSSAPPGAAKRFEHVFGQLAEVPLTPAPVRGRARLQIGSPTLTVPDGSTSEVMLHAQVRGLYEPDAGTSALPAPIHGEVQAVFEVHATGSGTARKLEVKPSAQDAKIQFIAAPGSGLSAGDAGAIATQVRKALRASFTLVPVDLPPDFAFTEFKGVGTGDGQAVALPLQLSEPPSPPGAIQEITQSVVGPAGFGFGISADFVRHVFQPTIDNLMQFKRDFTISIPIWFDPTYHFSVTAVDLLFNNRTIDLVIHGKATTSNFGWSDYNNIVIKQRFALLMLFDTLFIKADDYEPEVSGVASEAVGSIKNAVIAQRNAALPPAQRSLNTQLNSAKTRLNRALHSFDPAASATFRAGFSDDAASGTSGGVAIVPEGVVIRGDVKSGSSPLAPVVEVTDVEHGKTYSALNSWIPGGRIDRHVWSWVEGSPIVAWGGVVKTLTDEHRFVLSIPPPQSGPGPVDTKVVTQVCLRLEGSRTLSDGSVESVVAGATCLAPDPGIVMVVPSWWEPVHVPVWMPDQPETVLAKDAVAGHVTVQSDRPKQDELTRNALVHFADWSAREPLAGITAALERLQRKSLALGIFVVLPQGAFDVSRRELESRLASITERFQLPVQVTEDDEGGWTRTFSVSKVPSTYLINARRKFVWSRQGDVDPGDLAAALEKHATPAPAPRARPLRLAVSPGERAPDAMFQTDREEPMALHRLRGRRALLNFWQSWSAPCLKELSRLQRLYEIGSKEPPAVLAFHGGKDGSGLEEIRRRLGLTFALIQDSEQQVARTYGVRCWPTTIAIDENGQVEHVQFGMTPTRSVPTGREQPAR